MAAVGGAAQPEPAGGIGGVGTPVVGTLRLDKKAYAPTDKIKLTITFKNTSKSEVKLMFNSGMKYDIEIRKGKSTTGEVVWQWSRGRMFIQMITNNTLEPGKSLTFTEIYNPTEKTADGKPGHALDTGTYTATGILALGGRAPRPRAQATFNVK